MQDNLHAIALLAVPALTFALCGILWDPARLLGNRIREALSFGFFYFLLSVILFSADM